MSIPSSLENLSDHLLSSALISSAIAELDEFFFVDSFAGVAFVLSVATSHQKDWS